MLQERRRVFSTFWTENLKLKMGVECNPGFLCFCFTPLCDWSRKLTPFSQPIRRKTHTNRGHPRFPALLVVCFCYECSWLIMMWSINMIGCSFWQSIESRFYCPFLCCCCCFGWCYLLLSFWNKYFAVSFNLKAVMWHMSFTEKLES